MAFRLLGSSTAASRRVRYDLPERPPAEFRLEWADFLETGDGTQRGLQVIRTSDNRHLGWDELPEGLLSAPVNGTDFRKVALQSAAFAPGKSLSLVLEPYNPHDPNAVGVWDQAERTQIGFLPREHAPAVGSMIRSGTLAGCVSMWEQCEGDTRVGLRVLLIRNGMDIR